MKKTYMQPSVEVVITNVETMIAASVDGFNGSLNTTGAGGSSALGKERGTRNEADDFGDLW